MTTSGPTALHAAATVTALKSAPSAPRASAGATAGEPEKLRGLRRAMAQSMSLARDNVMNCTLFDDADLHRWRVGEDFTTRLLRAIAAGCRAEPGLNAWFDGEAQSRRLLPRVDVAMAVDTPDGLLVPVIRDVDKKSLLDLAKELELLAAKARDRKITADEMKGGTFTISNPGPFATLLTGAIINQPQVAILSTDGVSRKPVVVEVDGVETIVVHSVGLLALTFDHRAVDGAYAARFLHRVDEILNSRDWAAEL